MLKFMDKKIFTILRYKHFFISTCNNYILAILFLPRKRYVVGTHWKHFIEEKEKYPHSSVKRKKKIISDIVFRARYETEYSFRHVLANFVLIK